MNIAKIAIISALLIAAVAAFFSIVGLTTIFPGAVVSIVIFGITIEIGKLVSATLLKYNWNDLTNTLKYLLSSLVIVLMLLTSMGTFGYLSKAHLQQAAKAQPVILQVDRLNSIIDRETKIIEDLKKVQTQLDASVDALIKNERIRGADGAKKVRESQKAERAELNKSIEISQKKIDDALDKKLELDQSLKEYNADVGPAKYLAEALYSDNSQESLEDAVRIVIILLVLVLDPLAIVLLLAGNHILMKKIIIKLPDSPKEEISNNEDDIKDIESEDNVELLNEIPNIKGIPVRPIIK